MRLGIGWETISSGCTVYDCIIRIDYWTWRGIFMNIGLGIFLRTVAAFSTAKTWVSCDAICSATLPRRKNQAHNVLNILTVFDLREDGRAIISAYYQQSVLGQDTITYRIFRASRSITLKSAPTISARSVLFTTSRSDWVMPGPPFLGILSPPLTSI